MSGHSPEAIQKEVKVYLSVFVALGILTVLTVGVSYFQMPFKWAVVVALLIACVKASLVAAFFMHLTSEKKLIHMVLIATTAFFIFLLLVPSWHDY